MTIVEKMAMAMCEVSGQQWRTGQFDQYNNHWRFKAIAALKAIREPDEGMKAAALAELSDVTVDDPKAAAWDWQRAHKAAIDHAIQEHEA